MIDRNLVPGVAVEAVAGQRPRAMTQRFAHGRKIRTGSGVHLEHSATHTSATVSLDNENTKAKTKPRRIQDETMHLSLRNPSIDHIPYT